MIDFELFQDVKRTPEGDKSWKLGSDDREQISPCIKTEDQLKTESKYTATLDTNVSSIRLIFSWL